jgi:PTH1 family peptidyl-tRNA hydrolase
MFKFKPSMDYMIVGLGNPGEKYCNTRHNAGFRAVDYISQKLRVDARSSKFNSVYGVGNFGNKRFVIMKPQTFMNRSGESVLQAMTFYRVVAEKVILIFDDVSLDIGKIRLRKSGTHGGHNGVKSILELAGSKNFLRVKIGIGNKPHADWDLADWVLSKFSEGEEKILETVFEKVSMSVDMILSSRIEKAMATYN